MKVDGTGIPGWYNNFHKRYYPELQTDWLYTPDRWPVQPGLK